MKRKGGTSAIVVIAIIIIAVVFFIKYNTGGGGGSSPTEVKAKVRTSLYRGKVSFMLDLREMDGDRLKYVRKDNRKLMNAPRVVVTDKDGKEVLAFKMRYG